MYCGNDSELFTVHIKSIGMNTYSFITSGTLSCDSSIVNKIQKQNFLWNLNGHFDQILIFSHFSLEQIENSKEWQRFKSQLNTDLYTNANQNIRSIHSLVKIKWLTEHCADKLSVEWKLIIRNTNGWKLIENRLTIIRQSTKNILSARLIADRQCNIAKINQF